MTGQEARDDEREALKAILREYLGPIEADGDEMGAFADEILAAGYRKHPEPEITDEMVQAERQRQRDLGYDRAHDEAHGVMHLLTWAKDYARRGKRLESEALLEAAREVVYGLVIELSRARNLGLVFTYGEIQRRLNGLALRVPAEEGEQ